MSNTCTGSTSEDSDASVISFAVPLVSPITSEFDITDDEVMKKIIMSHHHQQTYLIKSIRPIISQHKQLKGWK